MSGTMPRRLVAICIALTATAAARAQPPSWIEAYRANAERLIAAETSTDFAWRRLAQLTDTAAPRLSGSPQLERAIRWAVDELRRDGFDNVHTEPVMVPKWVRGAERATVVEPTD